MSHFYAPLPVETMNAFIDVEVGVAQNWLRWCADVFSENHVHRTPQLLRQRDEARELIAEKCAAWFSADNFAGLPPINRVSLDEEIYDQLVGVHAAAESLYFAAEEYDFPEGLGQGAPQSYWEALGAALELLSPESAEENS